MSGAFKVLAATAGGPYPILSVDAQKKLEAELYSRSNERALHDYKLPVMVRGFIAAHDQPATYKMALREAGYLPKLYGRYQGEPVRVVMVSRLGDIGISREDKEHGYFTRCSIYDLTDYAVHMHKGPKKAEPPHDPLVNRHKQMSKRARRRLDNLAALVKDSKEGLSQLTSGPPHR